MADIYPWQQALWNQLGGRAQHAHAYLLYGPAGIGKRALAEHWAAQLLCQRPAAAGACGECKACQLLAAGTHPDYFVLEPEEAEKPIRVDQVRDLVGFVVQTAQLGGRKVVLLEPAEAMNVNAANALLKSLEEPSGDTVLLLISHQPSRLLPTIKSRCVQQACPLPGAAASLEWLARALPDEPAEALEELLALSGGSPLTAQRLHGQGVREQRAQVVEGVKKLLKQQIAASPLAESWNSVPLPLLFDWFCDWTLGILRYQLTHDEEGLGLADMRKVIQYLGDKSGQAKVLAMQDWLLQQRQKVLNKANLNRVLLLEALLVQWASLPGPGWNPADIRLAGTCMSLPPNLGPRNGILSLTIKDKSVLYAAYMPFIRNGGLFIPTNKNYKLGDEVFMLLNLMEEPEKIPVAGKVVWITPKGAQGNRAAGIGVQFNDGDNTARNKIETYLAGALKSDRPTHTM